MTKTQSATPRQSASELIGTLRGQGLLYHLLDVGRLVHFMFFLLLTKYLKFCHRKMNHTRQYSALMNQFYR